MYSRLLRSNYAFSLFSFVFDEATVTFWPYARARRVHDVETSELLGHGADHWSHTSQPEAKNTHRSKLPVAGHDLWPHERPRGGARWLEAHGMRKARPRYGRALPAARTHVWDITLMIGFNSRARI